jgi:hypothetical protein
MYLNYPHACDGGTGDNALWLGSSKAGIRLFPKGDEDLWQAGAFRGWCCQNRSISASDAGCRNLFELAF